MTADHTLLTVILNYRTPEMTLRAAKAALVAMQGIEGRIVIVDNDSGDGSFETIQAGIEANGWPSERVDLVASGYNGGFGAGNNFGVLHGMATMPAPPDFLYFLNSDAFVEPKAIQVLIDHLVTTPDAGVAGSFIYGSDGVPHHSAFRFPSIAGEFEGAARLGFISRVLSNYVVPLPIPNVTTRVDWLAGASMMLRRSVVEQVGLFDENFFLYFEETDLCRRVVNAGWKIDYAPGSRVEHIGSVSTGMKSWKRIPGFWLEARHYYFRKNHGVLYGAAATLAHVAGGVIWRVRRWIGGKPKRDPDLFLTDLLAHSLRGMFRRVPGRNIPALTEATAASPIAGDLP
ncbi:glycosyltransferase family 2 protein [Shimia biformata]|uniref:glycosyltransferase family 2 protein n=1 Tax=Shimia biformata TaxID=1294299 RepID=UPI0019515887|nr:glycosyltransferase family 2 protein [Shimia biformata]